MNVQQFARQIRFKLLARTWPDSPGGTVFANVYVSQGPAEDLAPSSMRYPFALVRVLDSTTDLDDQRYQVQRFEIVSVVQATGDQVGEFAMTGGHRTSQGTSRGRGLLEVEEQVLQALQFVDPTGGVRLQLVSSNAAEGVFVQDVGYVAMRALTFQARLTTDRDYPTPNGGRALLSAVVGSTVTLSWTGHERFDLYAARTAPSSLTAARGGYSLVRKSGSSAPTSLTDGVPVNLSANFATTATDTPGTGTWSYTLFPQYDEFGDATAWANPTSPPTASIDSWSNSTAGNFTTGFHDIYLSFVGPNSAESAAVLSQAAVAMNPGFNNLIATSLQLGPAGTVARKVYATRQNPSFNPGVFFIGTVNDNTSTSGSNTAFAGFSDANLVNQPVPVPTNAQVITGTSVRSGTSVSVTGIVVP
jgi:hypothetical protein